MGKDFFEESYGQINLKFTIKGHDWTSAHSLLIFWEFCVSLLIPVCKLLFVDHEQAEQIWKGKD